MIGSRFSVRKEGVEVSLDRSSGAPAEAPERMSPRVEVPYNVQQHSLPDS
jgi:hypothetical protein